MLEPRQGAVNPALVVCALPGSGLGSHDEVVNPGAVTFLNSFLAPPLAQ